MFIVLYYIGLDHIMVRYGMLYNMMLCYAVLYCIVLYYIILHHILLLDFPWAPSFSKGIRNVGVGLLVRCDGATMGVQDLLGTGAAG